MPIDGDESMSAEGNQVETDPVDPALVELAGKLFAAAREGRTRQLYAYIDAGAPVNLTNDSGDTLLMLAAYHGHSDAVSGLIERGADVDRLNDRGQSPLAGALFKGETKVCHLLLVAGADVDVGHPTARDAAAMFGQEALLRSVNPQADVADSCDRSDRDVGPGEGFSEERAVAAMFGDRADLARRFVDHLGTTGVEWGLLGPREVPRLWERHVLNCAAIAELVPRGASIVDLGSGAGLPGIVLAIARPDLRVTLVEPMERRTDWARMVVADLGLAVEVVRARAEDLHGSRYFDVVTSRAVASLDKLARWSLPLATSGGQVLAIKGSSAAAEVDKAKKTIGRLGGITSEVILVGGEWLAIPTTVVRVRIQGEQSQRKGSAQ